MAKIVFLEGIDGSGKSSVAQYLKAKYPNSFFRRFPDGQIRELLDSVKKTSEEASLFLFLSDYMLGHQEILEYLKNNKDGLVICDRSWISTKVYQGVILGWNSDLFSIVSNVMPHIYLTPNLVLYFKVAPELGITRCIQRKGSGVIQPDKLEFLTRISDAYEDFIEYEDHWDYEIKELNSNQLSIDELKVQSATLIEQLMIGTEPSE